MKNFNKPYFAKSISDFWSRWHISLSTWFRDYLYIPLGGNKTNTIFWIRNILLVFLISGLWHGANYTFIIWGLLHGTFLTTEYFVKKKLNHVKQNAVLNFTARLTGRLITLYAVVLLWVFFRASTLAEAALLCKKIAVFTRTIFWQMIHFNFIAIYHLTFGTLFSSIPLAFCFIASAFVFTMEFMTDFYNNRLTGITALLVFAIFLACIIVFGSPINEQFIYFQF